MILGSLKKRRGAQSRSTCNPRIVERFDVIKGRMFSGETQTGLFQLGRIEIIQEYEDGNEYRRHSRVGIVILCQGDGHGRSAIIACL